MSEHITDFEGSVLDSIREAIELGIANSKAEVAGSGGHYQIEVTAPDFEGKTMLESQRLVYGTIRHLMQGDAAPVHAVDRLITRTTNSTE